MRWQPQIASSLMFQQRKGKISVPQGGNSSNDWNSFSRYPVVHCCHTSYGKKLEEKCQSSST
uniref:Uncharacterized protein n=1 Tax=Rhizophora mucronata TaxID=61149 RepID=A0A2P2PSS4_RHIMU